MRGLTALERFILESALPNVSTFEWSEGGDDDDVMVEAHDELTGLGWLREEEDEGGTTWTTTPRGIVALRADALVRSSAT